MLLWLSMLSLVPFDIETIDSGLSGAASRADYDDARGAKGTAAPVAEVGERQADLVGTILALGMKHLGDAGPTRCVRGCCTFFSVAITVGVMMTVLWGCRGSDGGR